jgi:UDP-N-acetylmuramoyl-L-alanyl-D-glutamate--2,6-diaminopimelate ligase
MIESTTVRLSDLFLEIGECRVVGDADVQVNSLCYRSGDCAAGSLFFCVPGFVRDGHEFAPAALASGAVALCVERPLDLPVTQVIVPSVRRAMGPVSSRFFGNPSGQLMTVGITGTNGKTTSAFLLAHLLDRAGFRAGLMGTVQRRVGGEVLPAGRTTPESFDIQRDLAEMVARGDKAVVMEVSSHALELGRVLGVAFQAIAFTNLTQDHLDFHGDLDSYFNAKSRLFRDEEFTKHVSTAVINIDDPYGRRLAEEYDSGPILTFALNPATAGAREADLTLTDREMGPGGLRGKLVLRGNALACGSGSDHRALNSPLVGAFNAANVLTALGIGLALGLDLDGMLTALADFDGVPGRMQTVDLGQDFAVVVDYAHTPDSVKNVLETARGFTKGRLIAVIGCGGDRDRGKRPLMGRTAEELADVVVVTSDNPRTEDPSVIIADILDGLESPKCAVVEPDRRAAIETAINAAGPGDVLMILGKGHESGQEFADRTVPFDDREVARAVLEASSGAKR